MKDIVFKKISLIVSLMLCVTLIFSGCNSKEYNTKDDYQKTLIEFGEKYGYEIADETVLSDNRYKIILSNDSESFEFSFKLGNEKQMNYFEIWCDEPVSFDVVLEIANELSKKKFSEDFYYNVIENENPFYNKDDEEHAYYKDDYDFYKYDFLGMTEDYNVSYYSISGHSTLSIAGFTK